MKKVILFSFLALVLGVSSFIYFYPKSLLPVYEGEIALKNLKDKVSVTRDKWGIPHIEAQNELDLHRAFGWVMASDRLFQMDLIRRIANGQLSEVLGEKTLEFDILLRKLRIRAHMDDFWKDNFHRLDPKMIALMEAFFDGVHQYMETQPLPLEFKILGYRPRPFSPQEAMAASGYLALSFAEGLITDALHTDLLNSLPEGTVKEMWLRDRNDQNRIQEQRKVSYKAGEQKWYKDFLRAHDYFRDYLGLFHGSNSWVISSKRSKSGKPLLANDPHVAFSNPAVWYEAHLKSPTFEIYGHYVPVVPFASMGHSKDRAWAVTMSEMDDLDLYEEKINEKGEVLYKNEWVPLKTEKQVIKVKGQKDHSIEVSLTPHGPLLDNSKYGVKGKNIALKWSYHHPENDVSTAFYKMSRSKKLAEFDEALKHAGAPGLSISWADSEGNIAWRVMGKVPLRRGFKGNQILEGWSGKHEYERYFTLKENPGLVNPKSGIIVTANYRPDYQGDLPIDGYWQPGERFVRIEKLLSRQEKWGLEGLKAIQNDQHSSIGPAMVTELLSEHTAESDFDKEVMTILRKWKGESDKTSIGATLYHMWVLKLSRVALIDELGEDRFIAFNKVADGWNFFKTFLYQREHQLWDDVRTPKKEGRKEMIKIAYRETLKSLREKFGDDISQWQWGKLHTLEVEHPLGKVKPLNLIFNTGPSPAGGSFSQVDNMSYPRYTDRFNVTLGPSVRRLIDMAKPEHSLNVLPTGNVGHFNSEFYDDQFEMFLTGKYRDQWMKIEDVKRHPHQTLILKPFSL
jgi:penicillin amidase